jgi:hypothetical protein
MVLHDFYDTRFWAQSVTLIVLAIGIIVPVLFYFLTRAELRRRPVSDTELHAAMEEFLRKSRMQQAESNIRSRHKSK